MITKQHKCVVPKCGPVQPSEWIPALGEKSGRIYVCSKHRTKVSLGKAVLGAGFLAAFQTGLDQAAPGLREKIYTLGTTVMGVVDHVKGSMAKDERPAE